MFNQSRNFGPRPEPVKGNWICGDNAREDQAKGCGTTITELPFSPRPDSAVYCRDCWAKNRPQRPNRY